MFEPNKYQKALFSAVEHQDNHLVVVARAGTGKTTAILEAVKRLPPSTRVLLCAFNKSIQKELEQKAPRHCDVRTLHSLGFGCLRRLGKFRVDADATKKIIKTYLKREDCFVKGRMGILRKLVSLGKNTLTHDVEGLQDLAYAFDLEEGSNGAPHPAYILAVQACAILEICKQNTSIIDFDDMIWLPAVLDLKPRCYDITFVDEAQDLNACQRWMIDQTIRKNGRLVAVGDDRQAIYQFRGAGSSVLQDIKEQFDAETLPLSITYRCPKKVVEIAKRIVPDYEAADTAPEGTVKYLGREKVYEDAKPGDFVLSRTNAPLMPICLELLKQGVPAQVAGRDVGKSLIALINKSKTDEVPDLQKWLESFKDKEYNRLIPDHEASYGVLCDKIDCLHAFMEGEEFTEDVAVKIDRIFSDTDTSTRVICSTVHKSKGLERKTVWILEDTFRGGSTAEDNIYYVAITRTQESLFFV